MTSPEFIAKDQLQFAIDNHSDCFAKPGGEIYGITEQEQFIKLSTASDIYDLLDNSYNCENYIGLSIHATGWGAPLDEDGEMNGAPSEHAERRRIAIVTVATKEGMGSALCFADEINEIITDPGSASGVLADALQDCWDRSVQVVA